MLNKMTWGEIKEAQEVERERLEQNSKNLDAAMRFMVLQGELDRRARLFVQSVQALI